MVDLKFHLKVFKLKTTVCSLWIMKFHTSILYRPWILLFHTISCYILCHYVHAHAPQNSLHAHWPIVIILQTRQPICAMFSSNKSSQCNWHSNIKSKRCSNSFCIQDRPHLPCSVANKLCTFVYSWQAYSKLLKDGANMQGCSKLVPLPVVGLYKAWGGLPFSLKLYFLILVLLVVLYLLSPLEKQDFDSCYTSTLRGS